jgi:hypothetical protein
MFVVLGWGAPKNAGDRPGNDDPHGWGMVVIIYLIEIPNSNRG